MDMRVRAKEMLAVFRVNWKRFLAIHLTANIISLAILTPLYTTLLGFMVLTSGDVALTDQDIALFAISPVGMLVFVFASALFITFMVFEQSALILAAMRAVQGKGVSLRRLMIFVVSRWWDLFRLATRMVVITAATVAPFLALSGWVFWTFLTDYDINYYLSHRPPEFFWSALAIAAILLVMAIVLFRLFAGWIAALPLLLLERGSPSMVLRQSRQLAKPMRREVAFTLAAWALLIGALLLINGLFLELGAAVALWMAGGSLRALAWLMAFIVLIWIVGNMAITFLGNCSLSLGILGLFRRWFPEVEDHLLDERLEQTTDSKGVRLTARYIVVGAVMFAVLAFVELRLLKDRMSAGSSSEIIAHRGASAVAPENTLAAMEEAIRQGADWVEIDVQETLQGEVVVIHDSDLMKVAGVPMGVYETPLDELQSVDIGSWKDPRFSGERVPTLEQLLTTVRGRVKVVIELKYYGNELRLEERVAEIVEAAGMQDDIVLMSLNLQGVRKMKSLRPQWEVGLLSSVAVGDVTRLDADFFAINARFASRRFINSAHGQGRNVLTWTVNDAAQMSVMMGKQVDGVITDKPGLAVEVRSQRSELELYELFLVQFVAQLSGSVREQ